MRWNLKEAGYGEPTNPWANLWPDEQEPHIRLGNADKVAKGTEVQKLFEVRVNAAGVDGMFVEELWKSK